MTATIGRTGSFSGTVNLTTENLPAGITATFTPAAITSSTTSTTLGVTVAASVAPGPYTFTVRGQATGLSAQTATVSMTVTAKPAIAVALAPASASVVQGSATTFAATVTRTNFTGAVGVAITGAPAGVTATVTAAGDVHTVAIAVGAAVAAGEYALTATASGTGVTAVSAPFTLTVTAAPVPSIAIAATPAAVSIQAGATGVATTVAITRTSFTGAVVIAVQSGLPAGVTATNSPTGPTLTNSVEVMFAAAATTAPGTYTVVLQGAGNGATPGTTQVELTVTAAAASSIALSASRRAVVVNAGGPSAATTVDIIRNNFAGSVAIAASGAPSGLTAVIDPAATTGNSTTITFTAAAGVAAATHAVTVTASGAGIPNATVVVNVTVTAQASSIALSSSPTSLTIQPGGTGTSIISIARTNFPGTVNLAATGAPAAVTLSLAPTTTTANTANLTVAVGSGAAAGTYPITITGTGTGITATQLTISLIIAPVSSGGNVTWQFCGASNVIPLWFAAQNGNSSSAWTQVVPGGGNSYSFNIGSVGAVAYVTQNSANNYNLTVHYGTVAELNGQGSAQCQSPTGRTVTGTVSGFGLTNTDFVSVAFGNAFAVPQPTAALPNFTINGAPTGVRDLVGTRTTFNISNPAAGLVLNKLFVKRGLNPPNGGSVGTVDFEGADAFAPDTRQLTINGAVGGEMVFASNTWITSNQSFGSLGASTLTSGSALNIFVVPSSRTAAGDVQAIAASAAVTSGTLTTQLRSVTTAFRDPSNQSVTLGAVMNAPTVTAVASAPYARLRTQATRQSDYQNYWTTTYSQATTTAGRSVVMTMSANYIGGAASFDVTVPDFSGVGGWQNVWGPQAGASTVWSASMTGWVSGNGGLDEGSIFRTAQRMGQITP